MLGDDQIKLSFKTLDGEADGVNFGTYKTSASAEGKHLSLDKEVVAESTSLLNYYYEGTGTVTIKKHDIGSDGSVSLGDNPIYKAESWEAPITSVKIDDYELPKTDYEIVGDASETNVPTEDSPYHFYIKAKGDNVTGTIYDNGNKEFT